MWESRGIVHREDMERKINSKLSLSDTDIPLHRVLLKGKNKFLRGICTRNVQNDQATNDHPSAGSQRAGYFFIQSHVNYCTKSGQSSINLSFLFIMKSFSFQSTSVILLSKNLESVRRAQPSNTRRERQ